MLINGRYQILQPLQEGGFGHTFLAEDTQLPSRRRCVIKQLKPVHNNPEFYRLIQDRFQREAAIQETLGEVCPQIPRLYAYFPDGDLFYLVEEWIDGDTLRERVSQVGPLPEAVVREILMESLSTIETVHQHQIIHRDIKPDNIILRRRDGKPVLIDFGAVKESMATIVNSQGETGRSIVIGTTGYMPPEQSAGRPVFSSDFYSLGLTAIFLLTGRSPVELSTDPYTGHIDWRSQAPQASDALTQVIQTAIHMNPSQRFPTAQAMRQALQMSDPAHAQTIVSASQPTPDVTMQRPPVAIPQPLYTPPQPAAATSPQYNPPQNPPYHPPYTPPIPAPVATPPNYSTQVVSPAEASKGSGQRIEDPASSGKQWGKAAIIGGGLGGALLVGFVLAKGLNPSYVVDPSPIASTSPSSVANSPSPSPSASGSSPIASAPPPPEPSKAPTPEPVSTSPVTCGDPPGNSGNWYPVFINNADVTQVRRDHCQDAIAKKRDNGTPAVQVASFTDRPRAEAFAQKVGGDVGQPYQVGTPSSPTPSPSTSPSPAASPSPATPPPTADNETNETNAVIIDNDGATNVRRGPGTKYGVQHIAYKGDRVKILDSDQDSGGYLWYKVYFPKSGATGWIAGHLLKPD